MHLKNFHLLTVFLVLLLSLSACVSLAEDITPPPGYQAPTAPQNTPTSAAPVYPMLPPDPARGEPIYAEKCAPCHGDTGLGNGPDAAMLSNPVAPLGDPNIARLAVPADWYLLVTNGNIQNFMPPFSSLSVPERWDVIAFANTLSTTPMEVTHGQELYAENCFDCHGARGEGDGPQAGSLSVSPVDFTNQEFMGTRSAADLFLSITDGMGEMHSFADLAEEDRWALTAYLRTLTYAKTTQESDSQQATQEDESLEIKDTPEDTPADILIDPEAESRSGTVNIEVNHVTSGELPSNLDVLLEVLTFDEIGHINVVYSQTVPLPADQFLVLEDIPIGSDQIIFASIEHNNLLYHSNFAETTPETEYVDLEVVYYEQTAELSTVKAERIHIFFDFVGDETIQVYFLYIFSNNSDKVLTAGRSGEPALVFAYPDNSTALQRDIDPNLQDVDLPIGFGILDVFPRPEPYQVLYSVELPYEKNKVDISVPVALDTTAIIAMIPEIGVELKSDQLSDAGMRDIEGVSYNLYNGSNLQAGEMLKMQVSGKPKTPSAPGETASNTNSSTGLVIGLVAFGVVLIGAGLYFWLRNRAMDDDWDEFEDGSGADLYGSEDPDELMDAIITLDDLYQSGEIPEEAYLKRRTELKERLQELLGS